jgi:hypothetical protein|nr:MAG TPA: hypothetical protein [Caudoviricetes sp.]
MKYKVGDKVRVKENLPLYMKAHCVSTFSPETLKYNGMIVTVSEVKKDQYKIEEDNGFYDWYEDMLEPVEEMSAEEATKILGKICCESEVCAECPISEAKGKMPCQNFRRDKEGEVLEILKQWKADHEKKEVEVEFAWYAVIKDEKGSIVHEERIESPLGSNKEYSENNKEILAKYCSEHNGKFYELTERRCVVKE